MESEQLATLHIDWQGDVLIAGIVGEVDRSNAEQLGSSLMKSSLGARACVVDLSGLLYLDSAALTMLHVLAQQAQPLHLVTPVGSRATRLIEIGGLDTVLATHQTRELAVAAAQAESPA